METIPRRIRLDLCTKAEIKIYASIDEVEKLGADARLTEAVNLLDKARNLVADYIDGVKNINYYAIYQLFIDTESFKQKDLLVGFAEGMNESDAKEQYLIKEYPNDESKQRFQKGYLSAHLVPRKDALNPKLLDVIRNNKEELGVWA